MEHRTSERSAIRDDDRDSSGSPQRRQAPGHRAVSRRERTSELLMYESNLWDAGYLCIAGVDEVGRGALAGPLVAAAVVLPADIEDRLGRSPTFWSMVRDSKTLSAACRSEMAPAIGKEALDFGIGIVSVEDLDAIGLGAANRLSMELAVADLHAVPDALLLDAMTIDTGIVQVGIVNGDALSLSIAAASIVAKVHRDALMASLDIMDHRYGFARHKGYGVPSHLKAIAKHGPSAHHRTSFGPVRRALERNHDW